MYICTMQQKVIYWKQLCCAGEVEYLIHVREVVNWSMKITNGIDENVSIYKTNNNDDQEGGEDYKK